MNVAGIRDGLRTRLATVSGLRAFDTVPDDVSPPAALVVPDDPFVTYPEVINRGLVTVRFRVTLIVARTAIDRGQDLLDGYLSTGASETSSVVDAMHADKTLGGVASTLVVSEATGYGSILIGSVEYLKADLLVAVTATR